jgi:hypothetical protein
MADYWVSITGSRYYPFDKETWDKMSANDQLETVAKGSALVRMNMDHMPLEWGIVTGDARGPDTWAATYAEEQGRDLVIYEAEWKKYGKGAGHRRNKLIARHANSCLVFWDGSSKGTQGFIREAFRLRREIIIIGPTGNPWAVYDDEFWRGYNFDPPRMDIPQ